MFCKEGRRCGSAVKSRSTSLTRDVLRYLEERASYSPSMILVMSKYGLSASKGSFRVQH